MEIFNKYSIDQIVDAIIELHDYIVESTKVGNYKVDSSQEFNGISLVELSPLTMMIMMFPLYGKNNTKDNYKLVIESLKDLLTKLNELPNQ